MNIQNPPHLRFQTSDRRGAAAGAFAQKQFSALGLAAVILTLATPFAARAGLPPAITNVVAAQQALPSKLVNISYTLSDPDSLAVSISILVSSNSGATWTVPATNFTGEYGPNVSVNASPTVKNVIWNAGTDWNGQFTTTCRVRVLANDDNYALVPAGNFTYGDSLGDNLGTSPETDNTPTRSIYISSFYMDTNLVTGAGWTTVLNYALTNGYVFVNFGSSQGATYPEQTVDYYDVIKWCNARSQMLGAMPVYYSDATLTNIYVSGETLPFINPTANGYRLPTEAEWEKAARGGLNGQRFPSGNTINENQANYFGNTNDTYDAGPNGFNAAYLTGPSPAPDTSPVGSFPPNGYGMFDMAGNVYEWCNDWYYGAYYATLPNGTANPQGPTQVNGNRTIRAGAYNFDASYARCAARGNVVPTFAAPNLGFRCVRSY